MVLPRAQVPTTRASGSAHSIIGGAKQSLGGRSAGRGQGRVTEDHGSTEAVTTRRETLRIALGGVAAAAVAVAVSLTDPQRAEAADAGADINGPANFIKSPLGVVYEKINDGAGTPAAPGDVAVFEWVLRRSNGYFIYGTIDCGIGCGNGDPSEYKLAGTPLHQLPLSLQLNISRVV